MCRGRCPRAGHLLPAQPAPASPFIMSVRLMDRVWRHSLHSGTSLLVLLALADYANDDGTGIWPSYESIARKARISRRHAMRAIAHLCEVGPVRIIQRGGGRSGVNIYAIDIGKIGDERPMPKDDKAGNSDSLSPVNGDSMSPPETKKVTPLSPEKVTNEAGKGDTGVTQTVNNRQSTVTREAVASRDAADDIAFADRVMLEHASHDHSSRAISRAQCSEQARALMRAFHAFTGIPYSRIWKSACEEMAGAGVTDDDLRAAWAESQQGTRFVVNSPHSLKSTAIRIASARKRAHRPAVQYVYDESAGEYVEVKLANAS